MNYIKANPLPISAIGGELRVQEIIAEDPSVLGLGDQLKVIDKEKASTGPSDLDFLLGSGETRYAVEVQLGPTDESHIIRTIEYWDILRKDSPKYQHVAVLVAEGITGRFFNVVQLFNQNLPIMAIQMTCVEVAGNATLLFTRVVDLTPQRMDSAEDYAPVDRKDWDAYSPPEIMAVVDKVFDAAKRFNSNLRLTYNKNYITVNQGPRENFVYLEPQKKQLQLRLRLPESDEISGLCESAGFEPDFQTYWSAYRFILRPGDFDSKKSFFEELIRRLFDDQKKADPGANEVV